MSSGGVDIASLAIKVDVTDVRSAITELENLNATSVKVQKSVEELKGFFASLGSSVRSSFESIDSTINNHISRATAQERSYTGAFDAELKAREIRSLQSSDRRLNQILELQSKIFTKEQELHSKSIAAEKAANDAKLILSARVRDEIAAAEAATAAKLNDKGINRGIALNAYKSETAALLFEFERRVQLEQSAMTKGENVKATIRLKYAQQEEMIRARLANSLTQVQASLEQGLVTKLEAIAARESIINRAEQELIATNHQLVNSLKEASDASDVFHRVLGKTLDMLIRMSAYRLITIVAGFPGELFEVNKDFQLLRINLEGVMKSAEGARLEFKRLEELDIKTPFDLKELAKADLMMRNFGMAMTDSQFKAITDQVAQLGGQSETLTGILRQLGQAWGKNKLQLVDLRPMIEQGLPAITLLANAYGKNTIEILGMVHAGELGREAITKLFDAMEKNAPDAAARNMASLAGAMSNVKSAWEQMLDAVLDSRLETILSNILELSSSLIFAMRDLFKGDDAKFLSDNLLGISKVFETASNFVGFETISKGLKGISNYYKELSEDTNKFNDEQNKAEKNALAKADKERVDTQAKELDDYEKFIAEHGVISGKGAKAIDKVEKASYDLKKELYDQELTLIKEVENAKLDALDTERNALDSQLSHNKISIQEYYQEQLRLINEITNAKISSVDEQLNKEKQLFVATEANGKITKQMADAFDETTKRHNLPSGLLQSVAMRESSFNPNAVSKAGAKGLMQIMPFNFDSLNVKDPFNIEQSVEGAGILLERLLERYKDNLALALAAYNAGEGAVSGGYKKGNKVIPKHEDRIPQNGETPEYVKAILEYYSKLEDHNTKIIELESKKGKLQQDNLNKVLAVSDSVLDKQTKQTQAIADQELKVKQLTTSETDLVAIRKNAQAAADLALEKNKEYQEAKLAGDAKGTAAFEAEARLKVEKTVADAEIKLINDTRDEKLNAIETARTALEFSLSQNEIANETYTTKSKDLIEQELNVRLNALDAANEKYKSFGGNLEGYEKSRAGIIQDTQAKQLAATNAAITNSQSYQQELAKEELALFKLNHTAEEVAKKERELYFQFDRNYKMALARDKVLGTKDAPKLVAKQDAIVDDKTKKAEFDHLQRLIDINKSYKEIGINASEAFDIVAQGTGAIVTAFDGFIKALDNISVKMQQNSKDFKQLEEDKATLGDTKYLEQYAALTEKQTTLEYQKTQAGLQGAAQMIGAAKHLFKEQTAGYKALEAAEKVYRAIEMANALQSFLTKQGFLASFIALFTTTKATEAIVDTTATTASVANSGVRATAAGVEAAAKSLTAGPPPFSFAALAATIAALAAIGVIISGGGGGADVNVSEERQKVQGTGTVLGDVTAMSNSIIESLESIKDTDLTILPLTGQMARSLANIEVNIAGLGSLLSRTIYNDGKGPDTSGLKLGKTSNFKDPFDFLGNMFGIGDMLFGSTKRTLEDYGIFLRDQTIGQIKEAGIAAEQYMTIRTKKSALFGLISSSKVTEQMSGLDSQTKDQFTKIILDVVGSIGTASKVFGINAKEFENKINSFVLKVGHVSLKDLKGQELQDALQNIFSKAADQIAMKSFSGLQEFQRVGEGYYQTFVRVATGIEQAQVSLLGLGITAIAYTSILNRQGDVYAEMVRQSIVAVEQQNGVVNKVGEIIDTLQGTGDDIIATYKDLLEVRKLLAGSKLDINALGTPLLQGAGSLGDLKSSLETYFENYFTEAEQIAARTKDMTVEFAKLGFIMPTTKDDFRKLVSGIDTTTKSGQILLAQVLKLADGFDNLKGKQADYLADLEGKVLDAYDTAAGLLNKQIDAYSNFIKAMKNLSDSLLTGSGTILSNPEQYQRSRNEVAKYQQLLSTGTDAEKQAARDKLPTLIQQFLDVSRKYNASGLGYVKDFTDMQALIASNIKDAEEQKSIYEQQLEQLTAQVTALGLVKKSVDNVQDAVNAVNAAIRELTAFQVSQASSNKDISNRSAFAAIEQKRLNDYNSNINTEAAKRGETGSAIEGMLGWSAGTSRLPFSASGKFDSATGNVSGVSSTASGSHAAEIMGKLKAETFPRVSNSLSLVAKQIQNIIGGSLPEVDFKFGDNKEYGSGYAQYTFGGKTNIVNTDSLPVLERTFAKDMLNYLLKQMSNKEWASKLSAIDFPTLNQGLSALYSTLERLKHPFVQGTYDPKKDYIDQLHGSHRSGLDRVPFDGYRAELHENEKVLTSEEADVYRKNVNSRNTNNNQELKEELVKLRKQTGDQLAMLKNSNAMEREAFNEMIKTLKEQLDEMKTTNRNSRRVVRER